MVKRRRRLAYEEPVLRDGQNTAVGGLPGRRLRRRMAKSTRIAQQVESLALIEQATGFFAETLELSIDEARAVLTEEADVLGITMREAAERVLKEHD
ncbi:ANTAR domain-containing protein [Aeromicrobium sp. 9AM]|uniref:ANTAR domain-containing protein n=1 Tax=Aeromicrobium sp. 9AM TaxID=2653126 RepID=UPI0012EF2111|nr:ANTAR domain-containing protein [Aeromicrobium sp. 9AM]VXB12214.1 conserved hypothetical protein [Aeromicrobium sp. 9AM]